MRRYLIFVSAGLGLLMYSIDGTAVAVAFPNFIKDFGTNVLWAAWTISIYLVAVTSVMPLMGNLSDNFGRKKVYLISLILFTASSVACGLAPNIYSLVAFRFLQGIGGASFLPTGGRHRDRSISRASGKGHWPIYKYLSHRGYHWPKLRGVDCEPLFLAIYLLYQSTHWHWSDRSDYDSP